MPEYKHKSVAKLAELYEEHKGEMGSGLGMMALAWKALSPSIPEILEGLDKDEELLQKIKNFLIIIVKTFEEEDRAPADQEMTERESQEEDSAEGD